MKYHVCIGCLVRIPVSKKMWEFSPHIPTICDYCFFDVGEIITKLKGIEKWKVLRQYQVKAMMLRINEAGKFAESPHPWEKKRG